MNTKGEIKYTGHKVSKNMVFSERNEEFLCGVTYQWDNGKPTDEEFFTPGPAYLPWIFVLLCFAFQFHFFSSMPYRR